MNRTTIAVDIAKSVFEVAVSEHPGHVAERHRLSRSQFSRFLAERRPALVLLEACGSSHFWGRLAQSLGHDVQLLPPHTVRPYVVRDKTDRADAKGLLEAFRNTEIRAVPVKSIPQQTLTALHRMRSAWLATRTARLNTARGLLREFGIVIPVGATHVVPRLHELLADADCGLPEPLLLVIRQLAEEIHELEARIRDLERQLESLARQTPAVARLRTVPGIGLLTATALVGLVGDIHRFPTGRKFSAYLGLTPRESSSGLRRRLGAISKRGDIYLRMLLTHGARAILCHAKHSKTPGRLQRWALKIESLRGHNKATIALANKLARIAWAVWKHNTAFAPVRTA
jgi:transposase